MIFCVGYDVEVFVGQISILGENTFGKINVQYSGFWNMGCSIHGDIVSFSTVYSFVIANMTDSESSSDRTDIG